MVTGEDVTGTQPTDEERPDRAAEQGPSQGTPVAVWVVYVLGMIAAGILAISFLFILVARLVAGNGGFGIDVSLPAFILWLCLAVAAAVTFIWRRFGMVR